MVQILNMTHPPENMSYDEIIIPVTGRRMLTICGELDTTVPYYGGSGFGKINFSCSRKCLYLGSTYGFFGKSDSDNNGVPYPGYNDLVKYSYLNGDIIIISMLIRA